MPKKNRVAIYEYLFKEGVMVAKKDFHAPKHPELDNIPNLQVIKAMQVRFGKFFCTSPHCMLLNVISSHICVY